MQFTQFTAARADTGAVLPNAQVSVFLAGTSTLTALYNASGTGIANPTVANSSGLVGFAAPDGLYDIQVASADGSYSAPRMTKFQLADLVSLSLRLPLVDNYGARGDDTTDDIAAFEAMIAAVAAAGGGKCYISAKRYRVTRTIFLPGGVSLIGPGVDCCRISLAGPNPATIATVPKIGNVRSFVIARVGACPADNYTTYPNATGDYYISPPLQFAANTDILRGSATLPVLNAADTAGLAAGDWLYLSSANIGWHPAWSEYIQVQSVSADGLTITLRWPTRFGYSTIHDGIWNYAANFEAPTNPPGGIPLNSWAQVGWRKVNPAIGGSIEGIEVVNLNNYANYACGSVLLLKAIGCSLDIRTTGGTVWALDCQDITGTVRGRIESSTRPLPSFTCNGSNKIVMRLEMYDCTIAVEEGVNNAVFTGYAHQKANGVVQVIRFCDQIHFIENFSITNSINYGLLIADHVGIFSFNGEIISAGVCAHVIMASAYQTSPSITRPIYREMRRYADGLNWSFSGRFWSTVNNSLDLYLMQPVRANAIVCGQYGGIGPQPGGVARIYGLLRREHDGLTAGEYITNSAPSRTALVRGEAAYDLTNNKVYTASILASHTVAAATATSVTVNTFPENGSIQTGDILQFLVLNGSTYSEVERTVTSMSGATAIFDAVGSGTIVTGTDSECRVTRWQLTA